MASQKRKSSLVGPTAKRQKIGKDNEQPSVTNQRKNSVSGGKSKVQQCSQKNKSQKSKSPSVPAKKRNGIAKTLKATPSSKRKTAGKSPLKPKTPVKKTNARSTLHSSAVKSVQKKKTAQSKKARNKDVPARRTSVKVPKAVTSLRRSDTTSVTTSKASKSSRAGLAKETGKQNNKNSSQKGKKLSKILVSPQPRVSKKKAQCRTGNQINEKPLLLPHGTKTEKLLESSGTDIELRRKSERIIQVKSQSVSTTEKQAGNHKEAPAAPRENTKHKHGKQLKSSSVSETKGIRSKKLDRLSNRQLLPLDDFESKKRTKVMHMTVAKNSLITRKPKKNTAGTKKKSNKNTSSENSQSEEQKSQNLDLVSIDSLLNTSVGSTPSLHTSGVSSPGKTKTEVKKSKVPSATPVKRKASAIKPLIKRQKTGQSGGDKQASSVTDDSKSRRVSILDLCHEIAGEIESDTVEVVKEVQNSENVPKEESLIEEKKEEMQQETLQLVPSEESPSKCFFPSRKSSQMKAKIEQKKRPAQRNTKWNKIKLKKRNNFGHNMLRNRAMLPSLASITAKPVALKISQPMVSTLSSSKSTNKDSDATLSTQTDFIKPNLSENSKSRTPDQGNISEKRAENGILENHINHELEMALDESFRLHLESSPENTPLKKGASLLVGKEAQDCVSKHLFHNFVTDQMTTSPANGSTVTKPLLAAKPSTLTSEANLQKEIKKLRDAEKDSSKQPIIDAGQKQFGALSCSICGMLYTASNPEDETQHLLFHNQFISAVKYVGWKKERLVAEYPDGKIIMVLPDDPRYALKKVEEIREMVDSDLGFQQVPLRLHSRTKTLLFISNDKKVAGCLIAEHIQWGYRVIDEKDPGDNLESESAICERVKAWCCSTTPEPAICGISRIWVFSMMRRRKIASRMLECLRNHFIYGSYLSKEEIAFSDPTPDGKLFATHYCGTSQFLVYNFVNGQNLMS
ncbi:N-acetyltransferase ESCO1 [Pelobates fuscus]|uniref:N-acetyltransferase ESCO1 n=1 Tax=Pelobates fuscus TaxID=191477 RepID=UPI002FE48FB9